MGTAKGLYPWWEREGRAEEAGSEGKVQVLRTAVVPGDLSLKVVLSLKMEG